MLTRSILFLGFIFELIKKLKLELKSPKWTLTGNLVNGNLR